jgi:hypothetical protein
MMRLYEHALQCSIIYFLEALKGVGEINTVKKGKAITVTGHGGPWGCETSRLPHFLDNRLTDGGEVATLKRRPPFTPPPQGRFQVPISIRG